MVHDTEKLNFSEEFHGCYVQTPAHGTMRIFRTGAADLPRGQMRIPRRQTRIFCAAGADLPCGFELKMAETRRMANIEKQVARII